MTNIELGSNVSLDYDDIGNVKRINIKDESFIPIDSEIAHEILKTNRCLYYIYLILDETTNMFYNTHAEKDAEVRGANRCLQHGI